MAGDNTFKPKSQETFFLRPNPAEPNNVDTISSIEKAAMVVHKERYIAMFSCQAGMAVGPQGPPGEDQNSRLDTIIASASDEFTPITVGGPKTTFRAPYPLDLTNGYVRISLTQAPIGSAFIVNLTVNGFNLFTTNVQIDDGSKTCVGSSVPAVIDPNRYYIPDDAEFLVYVTQVGSTFAGTGLKVAVTGIKTE